jgi:hypothetical protein
VAGWSAAAMGGKMIDITGGALRYRGESKQAAGQFHGNIISL